MPSYVPHTDDEIVSMLSFVGVSSFDELFSMVPEALRLAGGLAIPNGLSEFDTMAEMERLAAANRSDLVCFAGAGAYDHEVPSAVRRLAGRTEFVTSYTPYQAEVAQGVLQALFEYQTFVHRLAGLEVANASLYDGATATVEAINLAVAATGNQTVLISQGVHPNWRQTVATAAMGTGHDIKTVPLRDGRTDWQSDSPTSAGAVVVQYPNHLGVLEDVHAARALADATGARLIVAFDPVSAGLLKSPGELGADVAVAEGQPFGTPMSFGGPYVGLFACHLADARRLPGRLVGETLDADGRKAYVTTLRTREQDIRREKASSNVCTNQTLIAVTAAIQLAWLGTDGLHDLALRCARATRATREGVLGIDGVESISSAPTLREFTVWTPIPASTLIDRMTEAGFLAGVALAEEYNEPNAMVIAATERRTASDIAAYITAFEKALR